MFIVLLILISSLQCVGVHLIDFKLFEKRIADCPSVNLIGGANGLINFCTTADHVFQRAQVTWDRQSCHLGCTEPKVSTRECESSKQAYVEEST